MSDKAAFLRSINLIYDSENSERIAHFQPTAKCVGLLRDLAGLTADRAFFVTAPYGSGKSLSATYLLHLVQNLPEAQTALKQIHKRLKPVSAEMGKFAERRLRNANLGGIVLALEGFQEDVGRSVKDAALQALLRVKMGRQARAIEKIDAEGPTGAVRVLATLCDKALQNNRDRVLIIWDEFGRHLERLVASGQAARIGDIQQIAEFVSRSSRIPITFSAIMHQGLLSYSGSTSQLGLSAWRKVEGRFKTIQYVDDSKELYHLVGKLISDSRSGVREPAAAYGSVGKLKEFGLLKDFSEIELEALQAQAAPLEPLTLYLLPRLAARAAQNERTLFGFLYSIDLDHAVTPAHLFDYFEPAMRSDTGVGGTYRSWLETESAISKATSELEVKALKTVCLLSLGLAGERTKTTPELLEYALSVSEDKKTVRRTIKALIGRKLLLSRKHTGQIAIWHGTDVDLRGRLAEEQSKFGEDFDVEDFLEREFPPPIWRPTLYNDEHKLRRFFVSRYLSPRTLKAWLDELALKGLPSGSDGEIAYVLCDKDEEIKAAIELISDAVPHQQVVFAVPSRPVTLREAALEVASLERMQLDENLLGRDPLVANELQQMLDDSRAHIGRLIDQVISPASNDMRWYYKAEIMPISSASDLRRRLSTILASVFFKTPRFNNEMIIRQKPSPNIVNARKKLVLGILERYGQERLGLEGEYADASIFRTILFNTGLYKQDKSKCWRFAQPDELADPSLAEVWGRFAVLLTKPEKGAKDLTRFIRELQEPPYGLRLGVIPILFAAALKAFPSALSIVRSNGEYVADLLPSVIEEICKLPHGFRLTVLPVGAEEMAYLCKLRNIFNPEEKSTAHEVDLIRECFDAIELWKHNSPPGALNSRLVSSEAQKLQMQLRRTMAPTDLLFSTLPKLADSNELEVVSEKVAELLKELSSIVDTYRSRVRRTVQIILGAGVSDESA
ncbi:MAG: hypothetical protein IIB77_04965, partial [Proteobacteria bacterium]|nr:hypothetical protein [Pseudomonadota bacterium]